MRENYYEKSAGKVRSREIKKQNFPRQPRDGRTRKKNSTSFKNSMKNLLSTNHKTSKD